MQWLCIKRLLSSQPTCIRPRPNGIQQTGMQRAISGVLDLEISAFLNANRSADSRPSADERKITDAA